MAKFIGYIVAAAILVVAIYYIWQNGTIQKALDAAKGDYEGLKEFSDLYIKAKAQNCILKEGPVVAPATVGKITMLCGTKMMPL